MQRIAVLAFVSTLLCACVCTAVPFNETLAVEFAKLASAAGCSKPSLESWSCGWKCHADVKNVSVCKGSTTQAFVGRWDNTCVAGFEGTHDLFSVITDARFLSSTLNWASCAGCRVHTGFLKEYMSLKPCFRQVLLAKGFSKTTTIRTTGWSLGGATSSFAVAELAQEGWTVEHYDFGRPRLGDIQFAQWFNRVVGEKSWRVTHLRDPVPHVPPEHIGTFDWQFSLTMPEAFYDGSVAQGHKECTELHDPKCSWQYDGSLAIDLLNVLDHFHQMDLRMGMAGCGDAAPSNTLSVVI